MRNFTYYFSRAAGRAASREVRRRLDESNVSSLKSNEDSGLINRSFVKNMKSFNKYIDSIQENCDNINYTFEDFGNDDNFEKYVLSQCSPFDEKITTTDIFDIYIEYLVQMLNYSNEDYYMISPAFTKTVEYVKPTFFMIGSVRGDDFDIQIDLKIDDKRIEHKAKIDSYDILDINRNLEDFIVTSIINYSFLILKNQSGFLKELMLNVIYNNKCYATFHYVSDDLGDFLSELYDLDNIDKYYNIANSLNETVPQLFLYDLPKYEKYKKKQKIDD